MSVDKRPPERVVTAESDVEVETWLGLSELARRSGDEPELVSLRPEGFDDFIGQSSVKQTLQISCQAAARRREALDHVLLHGPPGLGKTSFAKVIAGELGVGIKATSGPVIERPGDLAAILTSLQARDVLFIDEIHRLSRIVEEVLYPALEDYQIDILIGQGPAAKSIKVELKPFTLIGATTRTGLLTSPLRDRFGMVMRLEFYSKEELTEIVNRAAGRLGIELQPGAAAEIAQRSRGTPRIANRLLRRVRDFAQERADGVVGVESTQSALGMLEIDSRGLDRMDRKLLEYAIDKFDGGPVGVEALAAGLGEARDTVEDVYEPFLIQAGLLARTRRGRIVTEEGYRHLNRDFDRRQLDLLG